MVSLWGAIAFHVITTGLGMVCAGKALGPVVKAAPADTPQQAGQG